MRNRSSLAIRSKAQRRLPTRLGAMASLIAGAVISLAAAPAQAQTTSASTSTTTVTNAGPLENRLPYNLDRAGKLPIDPRTLYDVRVEEGSDTYETLDLMASYLAMMPEVTARIASLGAAERQKFFIAARANGANRLPIFVSLLQQENEIAFLKLANQEECVAYVQAQPGSAGERTRTAVLLAFFERGGDGASAIAYDWKEVELQKIVAYLRQAPLNVSTKEEADSARYLAVGMMSERDRLRIAALADKLRNGATDPATVCDYHRAMREVYARGPRAQRVLLARPEVR
ncbi:hypothetical protein [Bordetella genomosp. 1]|nr:hypothetical protein [Bordetella genomosp. 1]